MGQCYCQWTGSISLTRFSPLFPLVCPCMAPRCSRSVEVSRAYQRLQSWRLDAEIAAGWWHGETHTHMRAQRDSDIITHMETGEWRWRWVCDVLSDSQAQISLWKALAVQPLRAVDIGGSCSFGMQMQLYRQEKRLKLFQATLQGIQGQLR